MSMYQILKSDGTFLTMIEDKTINNSATSINLFGQGLTNYGSSLDDNFVFMLENFSNNIAPTNPLVGQLWYNLTSSTLNYYDSTLQWLPLANSKFPRFTGDLIIYDGNGNQTEIDTDGIIILTNANTPKIELQRSLAGPVVSTIQLNGNDMEITSNVIVDGNVQTDFYAFKSNSTSGINYGVDEQEYINILFDGLETFTMDPNGTIYLKGVNSGLVAGLYWQENGQGIFPWGDDAGSLNVNTTTGGGLYVNGNLVYTVANFNPNQFVPLAGGTMTGNLVVDAGITVTGGITVQGTGSDSALSINQSLFGDVYAFTLADTTSGTAVITAPLWIGLDGGGVYIGQGIDTPSLTIYNGTFLANLTVDSSNSLIFNMEGTTAYKADVVGNFYAKNSFTLGVDGNPAANCGISTNGSGALYVYTPNDFGTEGTNVMTFTQDNVATIANFSAPGFFLLNNWGFVALPAGGISIQAGGEQVGEFNTSSALIMNGDITAFSDERLKSDIKTSKGLEIVNQLRGTTYMKDGKLAHGVIAQEVQKVLPEAVGESSEGFLTMNYNHIIPFLIESIKELSDKIDKLEGK